MWQSILTEAKRAVILYLSPLTKAWFWVMLVAAAMGWMIFTMPQTK
jgi:hypothetical protein